MIKTSWNMPTDVILKQWLLLWKMWIVSHVVFFLIRNVKTQVHRGSWALTWWQLRNVIYVTTAITSDNLVCEISPLWTNLLFSILQSVFHYFTILWDGLFWNINGITNIPLSGAVFINCICLSYWWHTLVCKYIISTGIYCYTILPKINSYA